MTSTEALSKLHGTVVLWMVGYGSAADVVRAACDALVAGVDSPSVAILAGVSLRIADEEVRDLLPGVLDELGLPSYAENSIDCETAALRVLATRVLAGDPSPQWLTNWTHRTFGHDRLPLAEYLAALDDEYDMAGYSQFSPDEIDAEVLVEARRIVDALPDPVRHG